MFADDMYLLETRLYAQLAEIHVHTTVDLETMALQDIRRNAGLALIDPHRHTTHVAKRTRMTQKRIDIDLAMSSWRKRKRLLMIAVS